MRKKAWILLLFATLMALLCACSDTAQQPETEKPKIRIGGTTYAPYFYRNIGGNYTGIDVEIAEEACARIGYEPIFEELDIDRGFELLNEDYVDCLWCCLTMEGKEDKFIWAGPYMYTQRVVVVPADSEIETLEDLAGKCVAVQAGSISEEIILKGLNPNLPEITDLSTFSTVGEVFTSLRKGYADAVIGHESSLRLYTDEYPDGYRSLHITFFDNSAKCYMEMQLRTKRMDDIAEIGPANHLGYEKKQESDRARRDAIPEGECVYFDEAYERCRRLHELELAKLDVNMFAAIDNSLINDGCGLYRGRLILPYEHLSRFQNDLID